MFVKLLAASALTAGVVALPAPSVSVTTVNYKVNVVAQSTIDLSAMGAGEQKNSTGFTGYFTMTMKDTTGGKALTAVLDSMRVDSATQGKAELQLLADSAAGATWHGMLTEKGKIDNLTFVQGGAGAQQFEAVLAGFFPRGNAHMRKQGESWTDTLSYSSTSPNGSTSIKLLTVYTNAGEGMYNGAKALTITTTSTTSSSGSQEGPGGDMQLEGTGAGVGTYYVAKDGRYLGGTNTVNSNMTITMAQAPAPIPLKAVTTVTVSSY
jgi:hypothetical protein